MSEKVLFIGTVCDRRLNHFDGRVEKRSTKCHHSVRNWKHHGPNKVDGPDFGSDIVSMMRRASSISCLERHSPECYPIVLVIAPGHDPY